MINEQEKFDRIDTLIGKLNRMEFKIGGAIAMEELAKDIYKLAGEAFVRDEEKEAGVFKSFAKMITERGLDLRKEYLKLQPEKADIWTAIEFIVTDK